MSGKSAKELDRKGIQMLTGAGIVVVALFAAQWIVSNGKGIRGEDLCRQDKPIKGHTVILIDTTDPLSAEENRQLRRRVEQVRRTIQKDAKLSVFFIDDKSADMLDEQFCRCNPGSGSDANPLVSAPRIIAKKWTTSFGAPLDSALQLASTRPASRSSPIMEAIAYVSEREDFAGTTPERKIILISDLVQHSGVCSLLRGAWAYATFHKHAQEEGMIPDLKGAAVEIDQLMRPAYKNVQTDKLREFWRSYFRDAGVSDPVKIRAVRGTYRAEGGEFVYRDMPPSPAPVSTTASSGEAVSPSGAEVSASNTWEQGELDDPNAVVVPGQTEQMPPVKGEPAFPSEPHETTQVMAPAERAEEAQRVTAEAASTAPVYVDEFPKIVRQVAPVYPELARSSGTEGVVTVNALIGTDGQVKEVRVLRSIPMLDGAAMEAVRRWLFTPGMINGKPIHVWIVVPVRFKRADR